MRIERIEIVDCVDIQVCIFSSSTTALSGSGLRLPLSITNGLCKSTPICNLLNNVAKRTILSSVKHAGSRCNPYQGKDRDAWLY
jgi:hypothetical protein